MKLGIAASVAVLLFIGGLAYCAGWLKSDAQKAGETAQAFTRGMANGDKNAVLATLTAEGREKMRELDSDDKPDGDGLGSDGYAISAAEIDGDRAVVPVVITRKTDDTETKEKITLKLRREAGEWRIWAMRVPLVPGGEPHVTMDFEHPEGIVGEMFRAAGEGLGAALKGLGEGLGAMFKGMNAEKSTAR